MAQDEGGNILGPRLSEVSVSETQPTKENFVHSNGEEVAQSRIENEANEVVNNKLVMTVPKRVVSKKEKRKGAVKFPGMKKGNLQFGDGSSLNLKKGALFR
ncbi:unnamed protein product [Camellia sinensis]